MTSVSIAMATYNGERFVGEQLASFLEQRRQPDELVVCDDNSIDATVGIVEEFAKAAPFSVRIFRNPERLGFSRNFEEALSRCTKDIVMLSDQDDVWFANKIDRVVDVMTKDPDCWLLGHDGRIASEELASNGATKMGQVLSGYGSLDRFATGALTAVRREFLAQALPVPHEGASHDVWLHRLSGLLPGRRLLIDECLQYIRRHGRNASDWRVNEISPISRADILRDQAGESACVDYAPRIKLNEELRGRLEILVPRNEQATEVAVAELERERMALAARQALVNSSGISRYMQAAKMLVRGQYEYFTGVYSFFRDVTR